MIKFFRRIRQNLLSEGKTGKYLKYAIGEIVLVVIGILIALQININNQQKTYRNQIENILKNVLVNLESDVSHPITTYIEGFELKDSINNIILKKGLTYADYQKKRKSFLGLSNHLIYEFEPFQFQTQAYDRLIANIENIPDDYLPLVNLLQDVYSKEVPVVNEVALELKSFIDEIEDKYQNSFDWYSATDSLHFKQKVNYMLTNPKYLNDVKRHQKIVNHISQHLKAIKIQIAIAYNKIYNQIKPNEPFSNIIGRFSFPSEEELSSYAGTYSDDHGNEIILNSKDYYLFTENSFKFVMVDQNKFVPITDPDGSNYLEFKRDGKNTIEGLKIVRIRNENDTITSPYKRIK